MSNTTTPPLQPPIAVYYGTIRLDDGTTQTYSPGQIAALYNVDTLPYLAVPLTGPKPFGTGMDEVSYIHLKPQTDPTAYYDAQVRYNYNNEEYLDIDFDSKSKDRWTHRITVPEFDDI